MLRDLPVRLSARQVIDIIERLEGRRLPRSLLDYYEKTGLLVPSIRPGSGRGGGAKTRYYAVRDVVLLRWLVRLADQGLPVRRFAEAVDYLRGQLPERLADVHGLRFLTDGRDMFLVEDEEKKVARTLTRAKGQLVFSFAFDNLAKGVERAVRDVLTAA
jgi:DNA-binding transcriptional MerR regulator